MPNGSDGVWWMGRVHCRPPLVLVESGPHSFFSMVPRGENGGLLSCAFGEAMVAQTPIGPVYLSPVCKKRLNSRMIRIVANPLPFEQAEAHLVETMFYDQWAPSGESSISKPRGTFVPKWGNVQGDPEPDLRELLAQKKKRKEAPVVESDDTPQCVRVQCPNDRIMYKL